MPQAFASGCWMQAIDGAWYGLLYRRRRERKWESERTWNGFRWRGIWIWSLPCG
jgi:CubicO group peptidase (beta-lactamase class C family)